MQRTLALAAAAAFLVSAPFSFAQTQTTPQQTPQTTTQPAPAEPAPPIPQTPQPQTPSATPAEAAPQSEPQGCRTRKEEDEPCACLSDPDRVGTSTPNSEGVNVCVRPD